MTIKETEYRAVFCGVCLRVSGEWVSVHKVPSVSNFAVKGFSAKNGYSK